MSPAAKKQGAADDMADDYGRETPAKAQGGKVGAGEDLRDGDGRSKPDKPVLKNGRAFFFHFQSASFAYSPLRSKA